MNENKDNYSELILFKDGFKITHKLYNFNLDGLTQCINVNLFNSNNDSAEKIEFGNLKLKSIIKYVYQGIHLLKNDPDNNFASFEKYEVKMELEYIDIKLDYNSHSVFNQNFDIDFSFIIIKPTNNSKILYRHEKPTFSFSTQLKGLYSTILDPNCSDSIIQKINSVDNEKIYSYLIKKLRTVKLKIIKKEKDNLYEYHKDIHLINKCSS